MKHEISYLESSNKENESAGDRGGFYIVLNEYDTEDILNRYGPEGCYILARELMRIAEQDMRLAMEEPIDPEDIRDARERFGFNEVPK